MKSPLRRFVFGVVALGVLLPGTLYSQHGVAAGAVMPAAASGWIRVFGSVEFDTASAVSAATHGVYVVGTTSGTLPGQTSAGGPNDAFVRAYDLNGNELWTRQFGTSSFTYGYGVSATADAVYVVGTVRGALPGQSGMGLDDAFVRKYDLNGNELWTRQFGTSTVDSAWGVSAMADAVYVVGYTGTDSNVGESADALVRKYDLNGNELWTRQFGTSRNDRAWSVSTTAEGVYIVGETFDALPGQTSMGCYDAYVRKYDFNGNELWTRQFGTTGCDFARGVSVTADGVYLVGSFGAAFLIDLAFVRKYDLNGNALWTRRVGSISTRVSDVSANGDFVYVVGSTDGALPGQTSMGASDGYVVVYDSNGNPLALRQFGTADADSAEGVSAFPGGVSIAGSLGWMEGPTKGNAFVTRSVF